MVWVVVWRRRRGFIGGTGGASAPLLSAAPGGSPTVGTFDVVDTNVGSDICNLLTGRFWRMVWPGARCGIPLLEGGLLENGARDFSGGSSYSGGVALAE